MNGWHAKSGKTFTDRFLLPTGRVQKASIPILYVFRNIYLLQIKGIDVCRPFFTVLLNARYAETRDRLFDVKIFPTLSYHTLYGTCFN